MSKSLESRRREKSKRRLQKNKGIEVDRMALRKKEKAKKEAEEIGRE